MHVAMASGLMALGALSCNFVAGGIGVGVFGGASYLLWQCYDHAVIDVRRADTGTLTCDANVSIQKEGDDSPSRVQPCYHASLSEGRWKVEAAMPGFTPITTWVTVEPHSGMCPGYTHSVELSLQPQGANGGERRLRARQVGTETSSAPSAPTQPGKPAKPTKAFGLKPVTWPQGEAPAESSPPAQPAAPPPAP